MNNLPIGTLIYDKAINDYGIIIESNLNKTSKPEYRYYSIHWQNTHYYNLTIKSENLKWPTARVHDRIKKGEIVVIGDEKKQK